jgi:hypothetical protein
LVRGPQHSHWRPRRCRRFGEVGAPDVVIAGVDLIVEIAVGGETDKRQIPPSRALNEAESATFTIPDLAVSTIAAVER